MGRGFRRIFGAAGVGIGGVLTTAWWYRPIVDGDHDIRISDGSKKEYLGSKRQVCSYADEKAPFIYNIAGNLFIFLSVMATRCIVSFGGKFVEKKDDKFYDFMKIVNNRKPGQALITVSNHRSLFDDPGIFSTMIPLPDILQHKYVKYSLCAKEFCFSDKLPSFVHGLFAAAHTYPIARGEGIDQLLLLDFARFVAAGKWCHVFPEGGIFQLEFLGGRKEEDILSKGRLKWGVGKLIAHAPMSPIVIPFYHLGLEDTLPQDPTTKELIPPYPRWGHRTSLVMGKEIKFDDLIEEHEQKYGKLWKYSGSETSSDYHEIRSKWTSSEEDKILYSKICLRIENEIQSLRKEAMEERKSIP